MKFRSVEFQPRFRAYLRKHLRASGASETRKAAIWEMVATDPQRVQDAIEEQFWQEASNRAAERAGNLDLGDLFRWLATHWVQILQILLLLIPLILQDDDEHARKDS